MTIIDSENIQENVARSVPDAPRLSGSDDDLAALQVKLFHEAEERGIDIIIAANSAAGLAVKWTRGD